MEKEIKEKIKQFLKNKKETLLILRRTLNGDAVSDWWKVRNPFKAPANYFIIQISKLSPSMKFRRFLFRLTGAKVGKNVGFAQVDLDPLFPDLLIIEDNALIGWKVRIMCHEFTQHTLRLGRIKIGKNSLIGSFSTIRSGVTIGQNSAICMNSFVNKDIPNNELWGGVPAKK